MKRKIFFLTATLVLFGCTHLQMGFFLMKDNPREKNPDSIPQGKVAFEKNCAGCHGPNADGNGEKAASLPVRPTNFRAPDFSKSAARISARIAYGKGDVMPAFKDELPEETIWDIGDYLYSLQGKR